MMPSLRGNGLKSPSLPTPIAPSAVAATRRVNVSRTHAVRGIAPESGIGKAPAVAIRCNTAGATAFDRTAGHRCHCNVGQEGVRLPQASPVRRRRQAQHLLRRGMGVAGTSMDRCAAAWAEPGIGLGTDVDRPPAASFRSQPLSPLFLGDEGAHGADVLGQRGDRAGAKVARIASFASAGGRHRQ